jgi:hypothetical protein
VQQRASCSLESLPQDVLARMVALADALKGALLAIAAAKRLQV